MQAAEDCLSVAQLEIRDNSMDCPLPTNTGRAVPAGSSSRSKRCDTIAVPQCRENSQQTLTDPESKLYAIREYPLTLSSQRGQQLRPLAPVQPTVRLFHRIVG